MEHNNCSFKTGDRVELMWVIMWGSEDPTAGIHGGYDVLGARGKVGSIVRLYDGRSPGNHKVKWDNDAKPSWHDKYLLRAEDDDSKLGMRRLGIRPAAHPEYDIFS